MRMQAVSAVEQLGMDKGYATFWNASIMTELSDGRLETVPVQMAKDGNQQALTLSRWLVAEESLRMDRPEEPVFLLLGQWERDGLEDFLERADAQHQSTQGLYELYVIPTQRQWFDALGEAGDQ